MTTTSWTVDAWKQEARKLEAQLLYGLYPQEDPKEEKMKTTADLVAEKRAEIKKDQIEVAFATFSAHFSANDMEPGDNVQYSARFPGNKTLYFYSAVYGENRRWYTTARSDKSYSTDEFVDELVRLFVDADEFEWKVSWDAE